MPNELVKASGVTVPAIISAAGEQATEQYRAFFAAFDKPATRRAYQVQAERFLRWAEAKELSLDSIYAFDVVFYVEELKQSRLQTGSVALYRAQIGRLFCHLKNTGVITDDPFDETAPDSRILADAEAVAAWQGVVDAAEIMLSMDSLRQYGLIEGGPQVNQRVCEKVQALGKARGITPVDDVWEKFVAALPGSEESLESDPKSEGEADRVESAK